MFATQIPPAGFNFLHTASIRKQHNAYRSIVLSLIGNFFINLVSFFWQSYNSFGFDNGWHPLQRLGLNIRGLIGKDYGLIVFLT